jgi:hypothetical protein
MMRRLHLATLISAPTASVASAQTQESVRAIPLPDTVGANFAVTDTLTGKSGPADYDFLIGTWRFTFQARRRDGSFAPAFTGHWVFTRIRRAPVPIPPAMSKALRHLRPPCLAG